MTIQNRYEFVFIYDVKNGNPNGDPDAGNAPRSIAETGTGLVTDACIKSKIRKFFNIHFAKEPGYEIYLKSGVVLNNQHKRAYEALKLTPTAKKLPSKEEEAQNVTNWMCKNFFDIRAFGAVMTTEINAGGVKGPIQITLSESVDPISPIDICVTRCAVTNEKDAEKGQTLGRKHIVPYGLYRMHGFISANDAKKTGFSEADLEKFWKALMGMFEEDRSAARGEMTPRKLVVFKHEGLCGNAFPHKLFEKVKVKRVEGERGTVATSFDEYNIVVDKSEVKGVEIIEMI